MTERLNDNSEHDDDRDRAIEHIVDTQGVSYVRAGEIYDGVWAEVSHRDGLSDQVTVVLDDIEQITYRSRLSKVIHGIARLASRGQLSPSEVDTLTKAVEKRRGQLTYEDSSSSEED